MHADAVSDGRCWVLSLSLRAVKHFTLLKCDKSEAKSWDELWKSGEVDRNMDALQNTQKQVRQASGHSTAGQQQGYGCMLRELTCARMAVWVWLAPDAR